MVNLFQNLNEEEIFGQVEYFMVHNYQNQERMFAYIRKIKKLVKSDTNLKFFDSFGSLQFVEVIGIDRNVGFFEVPLERKKYFYIIDKYVNW